LRIDGIEYNIIQYLRDNEALDLQPKVGGHDTEDSRECLMIYMDGGQKQNSAYAIANTQINIIARSKSSEKAKKQIFKVFNLLDNTFGLELPEYSDSSYTYEAVVVPQISSLQMPSYLGADNNFVHEWGINTIFTGVLDH